MQVYLQQDGQNAVAENTKSRIERSKRFWELLSWVLGKNPVSKQPDSKFTVLDLACGICEEARVVSAFFSTGIGGFPAEGVEVIGIDQDPGAIQTAAMGCGAVDPFFNSPSFQIDMDATFICGDATQIDTMQEVPQAVDFVMMRHQFAIRNAAAVKTILEKALAKLKEDGMLLFTSFCAKEHALLLEILADLPCQIVLERENPRAIPIEGESIDGPISIDKFVCLAKKNP